MTTRAKPPFRADHVGSLLRPPEIRKAREDAAAGRISPAETHAIEDAAIQQVVAMQEKIGLQSATDGEFRRDSWQWDFFLQLEGVSSTPRLVSTPFRDAHGPVPRTHPEMRVTGRIRLGKVIFGDDFRFLKSIAKGTAKLTIPSPSLLHRLGGPGAINSAIYPALEPFWHDLAVAYADEIAGLGELGCTYLQIDDTSFASLCDPDHRKGLAASGFDAERLHLVYIDLFNKCVENKPADMSVCVHTCRGNYRSGWITSGGYDHVAEAMFNQLRVDGFFLEFDDDRSGGFAPLRFVPKGKTVVLGLVTTKRSPLEAKDAIKRRIEEAAKYVPVEQLCLSPQCGFASIMDGNALTPDEQTAKLQLVVEAAREVWG